MLGSVCKSLKLREGAIDEKFINRVQLEIAACAYRLRRPKKMNNAHSCDTLLQHFRKEGAPINKPFSRPPPTDCISVEDDLKQ